MPDGFLVTALWGAVTNVAGFLAGKALETETFNEWLEGCRIRVRAGRDIPENLALVRGVRTAHLAAIKAVALQHQQLLTQVPPGEISENERLFCEETLNFTDARLKYFTNNEIDHDAISSEDIAHLLDSPLNQAAVGNYQQEESSARDIATQGALAALESKIGFKAPNLFRTLFTGHSSAGWYDVYSRHVTAQISSIERNCSLELI